MIPSSQKIKLSQTLLLAALLTSGTIWTQTQQAQAITPINPGSLTQQIGGLVGSSNDINSIANTANRATSGIDDLINGGSTGLGNISGGLSSHSINQVFQGLSQLQHAIDPSKLLSDVIAPIQSFMDQITHLGDHVLDDLLAVLRGKDGANGQPSEASRTLKAAMGALNLPDPTVIASGIEEIAGTKRGDRPVLSGVNAATREAIAISSADAQTSRIAAAQVLSREAQDAAKSQLDHIAQSAADGKEQFSANLELSQQSQQAGTLSSSSAEQSGTAAQQVAQLAQSAQSQVSTQDVLKSQIQATAAQSTQLKALSDQATASSAQSAVQSAQLGNMSGQLASTTEIEAYQSLQLQQANIGIATQNQTLADISEVEQGRRQEASVDATSEVRRNNSAWSKVTLLH